MDRPDKLRLRKLVNPRLQTRLTLIFVGFTIFSLGFQFLLFTSVMSSTLAQLPEAFAQHFASITSAYVRILVMSMLIVVPLSIVLGILTTFRIVGPLHNITNYLLRVRDGQETDECRLRRGDEYQDLCRLVNEVTEPIRTVGEGERQESTVTSVDEPRGALPSSAKRESHAS